LEADDPSDVQDPSARSFRDFADLTKSDRLALAAFQRGAFRAPPGDLERVRIPVLVLCADDDPIIGRPEDLAERIPGARVQRVPGTHMNVLNNPAFARALLAFLADVEQSSAVRKRSRRSG
jgi:pimeloyl-ACP methyl ester carboxylesterase